MEETITKYLNLKRVRHALGIPDHVRNFTACSNGVFKRFLKSGDPLVPTTTQMSRLLDSGIKVLVYAGTYDWICNSVGIERFLHALKWTRGYQYRYEAENNQQKWMGGVWWEVEALRYVRVKGAGHMVPMDKPVQALSMVNSWIHQLPM